MANWKKRGTGSSTGGGDDDSLHFCSQLTDDDLEVAGIMLRLQDSIKKSESFHRFPACWGAKKKRSAIDCPDSEPPAPPPELPPVTGKVEDVSTSPTSPLAFFSPTDSDSKPLRSNKKVSTGLKGELLKQCEELTDFRDLLKREVKNVGAFYDQLMAENIILQRRRQQASLVAFQFTQSQPLVPSSLHQHHSLMVFQYQQMGPRGIPDLNASPEEYCTSPEYPQPLDLEYRHRMAAKAERKAAAALARRNRSLIQKAKNSSRVPRGSR